MGSTLSQVDIWNRALTKLGAMRLTSTSDNSKNARSCAAVWDSVLEAELNDHSWSCAVKRVSLSADVTTPAFGRINFFTLPAGFLRLLRPDPAENFDAIDYQIEGDKIATNFTAPLKIRYIYKISDVALMDPLLVEAVACKMAYEMCEELTQSNTKKQVIQGDYDTAIKRARKANAIQRVPQVSPDGSWITERL